MKASLAKLTLLSLIVLPISGLSANECIAQHWASIESINRLEDIDLASNADLASRSDPCPHTEFCCLASGGTMVETSQGIVCHTSPRRYERYLDCLALLCQPFVLPPNFPFIMGNN